MGPTFCFLVGYVPHTLYQFPSWCGWYKYGGYMASFCSPRGAKRKGEEVVTATRTILNT